MEKMVFGTATASFQIEGGAKERGRCIWDSFCEVPGAVDGGDDGQVACDHFHRYAEDVALMEDLGVDSYRFSISWPRIFPEKGRYSPEGMGFYQKLVAGLKARGISPCVTLYHWDLPQWAQDLGGWENRECIDWMLDYSRACFEALGADVVQWITFNEPFCTAFMGNLEGVHAPGKRDVTAALAVAHHLLVAHGEIVQQYRGLSLPGEIGITLNFTPSLPASDAYADGLAWRLQDDYANRWFLEPLFKGRYPEALAAVFAARGCDYAFVREGDFATMGQPLDFLGVNYYFSVRPAFDATRLLLNREAYTGLPQTAMGWDITPEALGRLVHMIRDEYTDLPLYITENGSAFEDVVEDGKVHDAGRVDYLRRHLQAVEALNAEGMDIRGYYAWSLLDNFEWARGYSRRFGLVYVDFETQQRIPKDSFGVFKDYIKARKG